MTATDALLAELRRQLPRNAASRDLIAEIRDGLQDAVDAYRGAGWAAADADRRAVEDFGDVPAVARQCAVETAARLTVRHAATVAISYPAMLGCWTVFYRLFGHPALGSGSQFLGNGFSVLGVGTCLAAIAAIRLTRRRSRTTHPAATAPSGRPIAIGFAGLTLLSVLLTYVLAVFTHGRADAPLPEVVGRAATEALSTLATAIMVIAAVRTMLSARRPTRRAEPVSAEPHHRPDSIE